MLKWRVSGSRLSADKTSSWGKVPRQLSGYRQGILEQSAEHLNAKIPDELVTYSGMYPTFAHMQPGYAPVPSLSLRKG